MEKLRLLVIEDDADQRDLICQTLEDHFGSGTVTAVATMAEALQQDLWSFDLILSDYNLPDANGLELLAAIRDRCSTPIILVTGENVGTIAVDAIRKGATDYVVKFGDYLPTVPLIVEKNLTVAKLNRENDCLRRELEQALADLREKQAQLEESLRREQEMAATDPLTGLYNRRHFGRVLEQLFDEAQRYNQDLSAAMIDMDGFKRLNDTHGHQIGDQLLMLAGKVISANKRRMDVAARYGGDEFVLLLPHAGADDAAAVAGRICEEFKLASASILNRAPAQGVSMSVGICSLNQNRPAGADQLIALADAALYSAKAQGRDRIVIATAGVSQPPGRGSPAVCPIPAIATLHRQI